MDAIYASYRIRKRSRNSQTLSLNSKISLKISKISLLTSRSAHAILREGFLTLLVSGRTTMNKINPSILLLARLTRWLSLAMLVLGTGSWVWCSAALLNGAPMTKIGGLQFGFAPSDSLMSTGLAVHPVFVWMIGTLGLAVTGFGLVRMIQLMRIYESGVVFDRRASQLLASFAAAMFVRELIDFLSPPLLSTLTHLEDGRTPINFTLDSTQTHVLFITIVFLLISHIMAAGHQLADDHAQII
jgi:hypothetical protein